MDGYAFSVVQKISCIYYDGVVEDNKSKSYIVMTKTPVAGTPSTAKRDIHTQMMLNVCVGSNILYTAYNRAEAARWVHENLVTLAPVSVLESRIKSAFRNGGRVAEVGNGVRVVKTSIVAKWRGREYHCHRNETMAARKRRLSWAHKDGVHITTTWRR